MKKKLLSSILLLSIISIPSVQAIKVYDSSEQKAASERYYLQNNDDSSTQNESIISSSLHYRASALDTQTINRDLPSVSYTQERLDELKKKIKMQSKSDYKAQNGGYGKVYHPTPHVYSFVEKETETYTSLSEALGY